MSLPKYPKYKKSGLPWIERVPEDWKLKPLRAILKERSEKNKLLQESKVLSVVKGRGIIPYEEKGNIGNKKSDNIADYNIVKKGDIVLNSMNVIIGSVGLSKYDGCLSHVYYVLKCASQNIFNKYYAYIFKNIIFQKSLIILGKGILSHRMKISMNDLNGIYLPIPPLSEQTKIANFLDYKCKKIEDFIQKKKHLIELLKEEKQVIINEAVTKGITKNVKLKPSGIKWLGDVPEHWEVRRLKLLLKNIVDQTSKKKSDDIYIALENIESWTGKLILPNEELIFESQVKKFLNGDILFGKLRPYLAKVLKVDCKGVCVGELLVLRNYSKKIFTDFMELKLRSSHIINLINSSTFGAKMPRANWEFIGNILFSYPPLSEQHQIVSYIKTKTSKITTAIEKAKKQIDLIEEYKSRLISEVVTGQLDVRNCKIKKYFSGDKSGY